MKDFLRKNGIWVVLIAALLAAILWLTSTLIGGFAEPLSNLWGVITAPARELSGKVVGAVQDIYSYSFRYEELEAENRRLKQELARLEKQAADGELARQENDRLRSLLDWKARQEDLSLAAATVLSRSPSNWESLLTINKGSIHSIAPNDCVVDENGVLVGVVTEVGLNWSSVRTVLDADTQIGAQVARTESAVIAEGDFSLMEEGRLKLTFLPEGVHFISGDLVLTSGLNGTYPPGLILGAIESVHTAPSGMGRYAVLEPRSDPDEVRQVFVITDFTTIE